MNFSGRYRLAASALEGDPIPLTRVLHGSPRRIIALDGETSVRHCALPKPIALIDVRGSELVTVLSGGRELSWPRWMAQMWARKGQR